MSILSILLSLAVFGFVLYLITTFIPMAEPVRRIIIAVAVLFLILWILEGLGALGSLSRPLRF